MGHWRLLSTQPNGRALFPSAVCARCLRPSECYRPVTPPDLRKFAAIVFSSLRPCLLCQNPASFGPFAYIGLWSEPSNAVGRYKNDRSYVGVPELPSRQQVWSWDFRVSAHVPVGSRMQDSSNAELHR